MAKCQKEEKPEEENNGEVEEATPTNNDNTLGLE
jgi:hypothetical protein